MPESGIPPDMEDLRELLDEDLRAHQAGALSSLDLDTMMAEVAGSVVAPPGPRDRLAALPSVTRLALGGAVALGVAGIILELWGLRGDLGGLDEARLAVSLSGLLAAAGVAASLALRGSYRPPLGALQRALVALVLLLPVLSAVIPGVWEGRALPAGMEITALLRCLSVGLPVALLSAGGLLVLSRWTRVPRPRVVLAGLCGGLVGFATMQLQCPVSDPIHLLLGHASLGLLSAVLLLCGAALLERVRPG